MRRNATPPLDKRSNTQISIQSEEKLGTTRIMNFCPINQTCNVDSRSPGKGILVVLISESPICMRK